MTLHDTRVPRRFWQTDAPTRVLASSRDGPRGSRESGGWGSGGCQRPSRYMKTITWRQLPVKEMIPECDRARFVASAVGSGAACPFDMADAFRDGFGGRLAARLGRRADRGGIGQLLGGGHLSDR